MKKNDAGILITVSQDKIGDSNDGKTARILFVIARACFPKQTTMRGFAIAIFLPSLCANEIPIIF